MTSPNLPFVHSGLIWDGITEYQNSRPEGIVNIWLLRMLDDSSRRYTEYYGTTSPMEGLVHRSTQEDAWETIGVTYDDTVGDVLSDQRGRIPGLRWQHDPPIP